MKVKQTVNVVSAGMLLRSGWTKAMVGALGPPDVVRKAQKSWWSPQRFWLQSKVEAAAKMLGAPPLQPEMVVQREQEAERRLIALAARQAASLDPDLAALGRDMLKQLRGR